MQPAEANDSHRVACLTEFRVMSAERTPSNGWHVVASVQLDADGKVIFVSGLLIDITAQKAAEKRAARQRKALPRDRRID